MMLSSEEIEGIAASVREEHMAESDVTSDWPDCFDISHAIRERLESEFDVSSSAMHVQKYNLNGRLDMHHYALMIEAEVAGTDMIVDASFDQFAGETDVPVDIAPQSEIAEVVVAPANRYIFGR